MDIITSHNSLDFDGLAAMVAAGKIYPHAVKVFSGTLSQNVKKFMALYKDMLMIKVPAHINHGDVERMIVVDTASANRLGHLKHMACSPSMDFYIYDHHPAAPGDLRGSVRKVEAVGAVTTLLVEEIFQRDIPISAFDATILALGIYEDTGSLLFSSTTARDLKAAAFLRDKGANLAVVANFMDQPFSGEQRQIMQTLLSSTRRLRIKNTDVIFAISDTEEFIPGLDAVTYRLLEIENCEVVFVIARMEGKLNVVGRSRSNNVRINEILQILGGRGHEKAASAVVKDHNIEEVIEILTAALTENIHPALLAANIMSTPVKTVPVDVSMEEAGKTMLRYGHTGMPVIDGDKMVGVISRRDVDKSRLHNLGHAPVKGFMTREVMSVTPQTPVNEIQKIMIEYDIGRVPVIDEQGRLHGIVSRTDILRTLHGDDYPEDHEVLYRPPVIKETNCLNLMQQRLPSRILSTLRLAGQLAAEQGMNVYLVGGFVRDFFLGVPNFDVDLVVEGDGIELARRLGETLGARVRVHQRFKTAVVILPDDFKIDVATARTEYYEFPAALPRVQRSSVKEDLYRRDFTINTLALCLCPEKFGDLIDFFGGRRDLENGVIRILYNLSFVEDPTRIIRAIRFEQRYRFVMEPDTLRFARDAIERRLLGQLSYSRIMHELILILSEKDPVPSLERMNAIGVWDYIFPEVDLDALDWNDLRRIAVLVVWWQERYNLYGVRPWLVYILFLLSGLSREEALKAVKKYPLSKHLQKSLEESFGAPQMASIFCEHYPMLPSELDKLLAGWTQEGLIYLLLCIKDEQTWENTVKYLDLKERVKVIIDGNDLKRMGLKPGPIYSRIFEGLYLTKLDGHIKNREEELALVTKWIEEDKFKDASN